MDAWCGIAEPLDIHPRAGQPSDIHYSQQWVELYDTSTGTSYYIMKTSLLLFCLRLALDSVHKQPISSTTSQSWVETHEVPTTRRSLFGQSGSETATESRDGESGIQFWSKTPAITDGQSSTGQTRLIGDKLLDVHARIISGKSEPLFTQCTNNLISRQTVSNKECSQSMKDYARFTTGSHLLGYSGYTEGSLS